MNKVYSFSIILTNWRYNVYTIILEMHGTKNWLERNAKWPERSQANRLALLNTPNNNTNEQHKSKKIKLREWKMQKYCVVST